MKLCIELYDEKLHPTVANAVYKFVVGDVGEPYQREDGEWWVNVNGTITGAAFRVNEIQAVFAIMANEADLNMDNVEFPEYVLRLM